MKEKRKHKFKQWTEWTHYYTYTYIFINIDRGLGNMTPMYLNLANSNQIE